MPRSRIAVGQGEWTFDWETNVQRMEHFIQELYDDWGSGVNLVTFCEYAVCGTPVKASNPRGFEEAAQSIPGPATDRLAAMAKKTGYYICNGSMVERAEDGAFYNTAVILGPEGEIVHRYRKTHPWQEGGENVEIGREFPVTDIPGVGKVGTMICYDGHIPECARALAFNGAEIILWNSMSFHPLKEITLVFAQARANENQCYVVFAGGAGPHGGIGLIANSMIIDPHGVVISRAGDGPTLYMDVVDTYNVEVAREVGAQHITASLKLLAQLDHDYPQSQHSMAAK